MTNEQAKSELMQIYMSLSEEKKLALDVLMAQNCDQCEVGNACLYCEYEFKAQADGEYIPKQAVLENIDQWYEDKADIEDLIVKITYIQGVAIPSAEPKIVPIAEVKFDDDMLHEIVEEAVKNIVVEYDFKGMTNGEVIKAVFPDIPRTLEWHIQNVTDDDWWNSPYEPQESEDKE